MVKKFFQPFLIIIAFSLAFLTILIPVIKENLGKAGEVNAETIIPLSSPTTLVKVKTATDSAEFKAAGEVDYYLPYPGILPDHPFYWLKMVRDRLNLMLSKEPLGRFERLLLFADKRIGAAEVLIKGRKFRLGVSTAYKAEIYLEQAVNQFAQLVKEGKNTAMLEDKISKAVAKHQEILRELEDISEEEQGNLNQLWQKTEKLQQQLRQLIEKPAERE